VVQALVGLRSACRVPYLGSAGVEPGIVSPPGLRVGTRPLWRGFRRLGHAGESGTEPPPGRIADRVAV